MSSDPATPPSRILIVKLSSLGDVVHALPVPGHLRGAFPQARLAWVIEEKWAPLIARHPDLDEIFTIDTHRKRRQPHRRSGLREAMRKLRAFAPDHTVDLQGNLKSAVLTLWSGAPARIGFALPTRRERWAGFAYNRWVRPRSLHVVEHMLELAEAVDPRAAYPQKPSFPFPIPETVQREVDAWIEQNRVGEFVFFSPGGGWMSKRWPSERYAALAEMLVRDYGLTSVLNRGPDEKGMDDAYRRASEIRARLFSGDIEHLGAILTRARLAVGGDTGPMQLAAALGVPTVALFGPTDADRTSPYSELCHMIRRPGPVSYRRGSAYSPAMLAITPEEVAAACGQVLARHPSPTPAVAPATES